jgi:hypothetical protein
MPMYPVAEFTDPCLGDKVNSGIGLSDVAWRAGTTTLFRVDFIPQSGIYEFGYRRYKREQVCKGCSEASSMQTLQRRKEMQGE